MRESWTQISEESSRITRAHILSTSSIRQFCDLILKYLHYLLRIYTSLICVIVYFSLTANKLSFNFFAREADLTGRECNLISYCIFQISWWKNILLVFERTFRWKWNSLFWLFWRELTQAEILDSVCKLINAIYACKFESSYCWASSYAVHFINLFN